MIWLPENISTHSQQAKFFLFKFFPFFFIYKFSHLIYLFFIHIINLNSKLKGELGEVGLCLWKFTKLSAVSLLICVGRLIFGMGANKKPFKYIFIAKLDESLKFDS